MSVYYQCRFDKVVLDLSNELGKYKMLKEAVVNEHTNKLSALLDNQFQDDIVFNIDTNNIKSVKIDLCFGNKNKSGKMTNVINLLVPHMTDGYVLWYNEDYISVLTKEDIPQILDGTLEENEFFHSHDDKSDAVFNKYITDKDITFDRMDTYYEEKILHRGLYTDPIVETQYG